MADKVKTEKGVVDLNFLRVQDSPAVKCVYDENRDIKEVKSGQSIDLNDALRTGVIPASSSPLDENGIDDPDNILGRVHDKFDAIDAQRAIKKYGRKVDISKATQQQAQQQPPTE